jgi:uncharacterized protein YndB with AHSA1/START domain
MMHDGEHEIGPRKVDDRDYGLLEPGPEDRWSLRFTRQLPHRPEKVWRALTEPQHLGKWFPTDIEGDRSAGAKLRFVFREGEGPTMDGEMLAFDPPKVLEMRWGEELLRFELRPDGDRGERTVLEFTNVFDELGKAARDAAGWHACMDLLAYDVDGREPPWPSNERWKHVQGEYQERLGPEASVIGPPEEWKEVYGEG